LWITYLKNHEKNKKSPQITNIKQHSNVLQRKKEYNIFVDILKIKKIENLFLKLDCG